MKPRSVTIRDVAEYAGLSTATVSRVLNDDGKVVPATREKVLQAVGTLGYKVNYVARSLKTSRTKTVGILAPDLTGDFFMYIAESLDRELSAHGYSLVVSVSRDSPEEEARRVRHLAERLVDGIVVIPATGKGAHFGILEKFHIPLVFVDRGVDDIKADAVLAENRAGAYEATKALIGDGYGRIGYIGGNLGISSLRERFEGYSQALAEAGIRMEDDFACFGQATLPFGFSAMKAMLAKEDAPDAWFLANAFIHVGATNYLLTEGKERSRFIVFSAFDEMPYSPLLRFCRYSVRQPIAELGKIAARLILGRIEGPEGSPTRTIRLRTELVRHGYTPEKRNI